MKPPRLGRDQLHILNEHRHERDPSFLRDVVNPGLAGAHVNAVTTRALGEDNQMKLAAGPRKILQVANAAGIELAALQEETNPAAQEPLDPGCVPHVPIPQDKDRITLRPPAKRAEQDGVEQADVIANKQILLISAQTFHPVGSPQVRQGEKQMRAEAQQ